MSHLHDRFLLADILKTESIRSAYMKHHNLTEKDLETLRNKLKKTKIPNFQECKQKTKS